MMAKFQYGLSDESWLGVRFAPWAHESTHLGDEYTILAQNFGTFERVNPSFVEAALQAGVEVSDEARSIMAVLASMAPGASAKARAGRAVTAYFEYRGF